MKDLKIGAAQWRIGTDTREEGWFSNQSILTIFLWKPRVGKISAIKDKRTIEHYKTALQSVQEKLNVKSYFIDSAPVISGQFTRWHPVKMQNIIEYLTQNDPNRPNFAEMGAR